MNTTGGYSGARLCRRPAAAFFNNAFQTRLAFYYSVLRLALCTQPRSTTNSLLNSQRAASICPMSDVYRDLLDAAILHLEEIKSRGVRFVHVSAEALSALNQTPQDVSAKKPVAASPPEMQP